MVLPKEVNYTVTANTAQAEQAFNRLANANKTSASGFQNNRMAMVEFTRVIQDAPYGIQGMANNITQLATTMGLGGGWLTTISLATTALVVFAGQTRKTQEVTDEFSKSLKSMIELADPTKGMKFLVDKKSVEAALSIIDDEIKKLKELNTQRQASLDERTRQASKGMAFLTEQLSSKEQSKLDILKKELETYGQMKTELETRLKVSERLRELGFQQKTEAENTAKAFAQIVYHSKELRDVFPKGLAPIENSSEMKSFQDRMKRFGIGQLQGVNVPDVNLENMIKDFQKYYDPAKMGFDSLMDTMNNSWVSGWENMFGEANSMFEQWASGLSQRAFNYGLNSLFSMALDLIPGSSVVKPILGLKSMQPGNSYNSGNVGQPSTIIIPVNVGNKTTETLIIETTSRAQRLRYV